MRNLVISIILVLLLLLFMLWISSPPISVSFRTSLLLSSTKVLQVHNNSDSKYLFCTLVVKSKNSMQKKTYDFELSPSETKEFGILELDWCFESGETGYIKVLGYRYYYFTVP